MLSGNRLPAAKSERPKTAILVGEVRFALAELRSLLDASGIELVLSTTSPRRALESLRSRCVNAVVVNLDAKPDDPLGLIRSIRTACPEAAVIALAESSSDAELDGAIEAGAAAYVSGAAHAQDLVTAVRQVFQPSIFFSQRPIRTPKSSPAALTPREREILCLVAEGATNAELARRLWVTQQTIKFHLSNIYRKIGVSNRTEAGRYAQQHGLLPDDRAPARETQA